MRLLLGMDSIHTQTQTPKKHTHANQAFPFPCSTAATEKKNNRKIGVRCVVVYLWWCFFHMFVELFTIFEVVCLPSSLTNNDPNWVLFYWADGEWEKTRWRVRGMTLFRSNSRRMRFVRQLYHKLNVETAGLYILIRNKMGTENCDVKGQFLVSYFILEF